MVRPNPMTERRVLVAEDDPVFRRVIAFTLKQSGFTVETASDGAKAREILETSDQRFELLVTDHQMPRCSGLELIEHLRKDTAFDNLSVVLCTGRGLELDKNQLKSQFRITEIMNKPFSPRVLAEIVKKQLDAEEPESVTS